MVNNIIYKNFSISKFFKVRVIQKFFKLKKYFCKVRVERNFRKKYCAKKIAPKNCAKNFPPKNSTEFSATAAVGKKCGIPQKGGYNSFIYYCKLYSSIIVYIVYLFSTSNIEMLSRKIWKIYLFL